MLMQVGFCMSEMDKGTVMFLYSSKEERLNNATALKEYLET